MEYLGRTEHEFSMKLRKFSNDALKTSFLGGFYGR